MPITYDIRENGHIFYFVFTDPWTIEELIPLVEQGKIDRSKATHKIHIFVDLHAAETSPKNAIGAHVATGLAHPNTGYMAVWYRKSLIKALTQIVLQLVRFDRVKFFENEADAWAFLRERIAAEKR